MHTKTYYKNLAQELEQAKRIGGQKAVLIKLEEIGDRIKLGASHPKGAFPY